MAQLRLEYLVKNEPITEGSLKKTRFCPVPGIVVMHIEIRTEKNRQVWASGSGMNSYEVYRWTLRRNLSNQTKEIDLASPRRRVHNLQGRLDESGNFMASEVPMTQHPFGF